MTPDTAPKTMFHDPLYQPTDWTAQCDAKCRKTGARCPHRCRSQIPNILAAHNVMDGRQFTVLGRPARLCNGHSRSWWLRSKRLLTIPLVDGGHLSPYNQYGNGSMVIGQDRLDFKSDNMKATIPKAWTATHWSGRVPDGLLEKLGVKL